MKRSSERILTTHCGRLPDPDVIDDFRAGHGLALDQGVVPITPATVPGGCS